MRRDPVERRLKLSGVELCVWEWEGAPPSVLLVHATGFHGRCWDGVVAALPGVHCLAVDQRGHGRSEKRGPYGWGEFGRDAVELCDAYGLRSALGVGHSLGGHVITQLAAARPASLASLLLIDPVILPPDVYVTRRSEPASDEAHFTSRRRRHFDSPAAMFERFESRLPYASWRRDVLRAYCEFGLEPTGDVDASEQTVSEDATGAYTLACPPEVEAAIYAAAPSYAIHEQIPRVAQPVRVVRARARDGGAAARAQDFSASPTWPELARHFRRGRDTYVPELSHFIPMEAPERTANWILEARASIEASRDG